jgi:hypothetical protein
VPNIENLRKQAKLYMRWHKSGYHRVAPQIRSTLIRFGGMSDTLASDFKLSDAQELVARKNGLESWAALINGVDALTSTTSARIESATIKAAEPMVFGSELEGRYRGRAPRLPVRDGHGGSPRRRAASWRSAIPCSGAA